MVTQNGAAGVQSGAMATDETVVYARRPLPRVGEYLRALYDLGRKSIPAALPALVFLWFYHFGTSLYLELAGGATSPLGFRDNQALIVQLFMKVSAYLPLLVCVYTPFLPLQDSLMRGQRITFVEAIRHVLERLVPFALSVLLQMAIAFIPVVLIVGLLLAVVTPFPDLPRGIVAMLALVTVGPILVWLFLSGMFLVFAVPAVVLDGYGPVRAITMSARLVAGHFWGIFWRFLVFFLALFVAVIVASIPAAIFAAMGAVVTREEFGFRVVTLLWTGLVTALTFPFWVGALIVLYRSLAPAGGASAIADESEMLAAKLAAGQHPTPFIFE
jgi:hypothetical protein